MTLLAVPPLIPAIHRSLPLDEKLVGALSSLPILLLATATVLGSALISRLGARNAVLIGLALVATAGAARGIGPSVVILFAATLVMGVGIAVTQPALPSLVAMWLPDRIGLGTAAFSNGFLVGEILPAALTVPWVLAACGSWQVALAAWSAPVAMTLLGVLLLSPTGSQAVGRRAGWVPDWGNPTVILLGLSLGGASAAYFGLNAFIPDYLRSTHHPETTTAALTCLNLFQLPASLVVGFLARYVLGRRWPFVVTGVLTVVAAIAFVHTTGLVQAAAAGVVGYASAQVFILVLAIPPLLTGADQVHRVTAGISTIQYATAFVAPIAAGAAWDATGWNGWAYLLVILSGAVMGLAPLALRIGHLNPGRA